VVSTDDSRERALASGAIGFLAKPLQSIDEVDDALGELHRFVEARTRKLLVAMPPSALRDSYVGALPADQVEIVIAESADAVRGALARNDIDALATDGRLAGLDRRDVAEFVEGRPAATRQLPVLLHGPDGPVPGWERGAAGAVLRVTDSLEALIDATAFCLHRDVARMSEPERRAVEAMHQASGSLAGRKVLIVDDDMRNIFALAAVLDAQGMLIVSAENGRDAIRLVQQDDTIDIVLMDIMMPEMDGMQTMRELRRLPRGKQLPLVAVTAKAMKGDREKCIEAGAWDYLSKPVDTAYLLMVLRGWLCK
jgi:CheY-like chemotaxis protein